MKASYSRASLPEQVRVSLGSAVVLGLATAKLDAVPTTVYLMTYREGKCSANCGFCPQARKSNGRADMLSRISWPLYQIDEVLKRLPEAVKIGKIKRVCIQALNHPLTIKQLDGLARAINHSVKVPISVSCQPLRYEDLFLLRNSGVERIGIPLDAATSEIFDRLKGAKTGGLYDWEREWQLLARATDIFGKDKVSTHLIVGLGETENEMVNAIYECVKIGVLPALFAFTPVSGTALEHHSQPPIEQYRRIQVARHLLVHRIARPEKMAFDGERRIVDFGISKRALLKIVECGKPFITSGCPGCNRPFYNEKPSGPIYNFPAEISRTEISSIEKQLGLE